MILNFLLKQINYIILFRLIINNKNFIHCEQIEENKYTNPNVNLLCAEKCNCLGSYVDCGKLNLTDVPELPKWTVILELSKNCLNVENIENSLINLAVLKELKLESNNLSQIPAIHGLNNLKELSLGSNLIERIETNKLLIYDNLLTLDLRKNSIKIVLENSFPEKNRLTKLYLNGNQIAIIEDDALNLAQLQELRLGWNRISSIPIKPLKRTKNLKKLELNNNKIYEIRTNSFEKLNRLKLLKLKHNKIEKIYNDAFAGLMGLTSLYLSENELTEIEENHYKGLNELKELYLDENKITYIAESSFNSTPNLEKLFLNNNRISLDEDGYSKFSALKYLNKLDLRSNQIKIIQKQTFAGLIRLKYLDLQNNDITAIQPEAFIHFSLTDLFVNTKYLICDCNVIQFHNLIKQHESFKISAMCHYPEILSGKKLKELDLKNLTCNDRFKPIFTEEPKSQIVINGSNMTLTCNATSSSEISIKWRKDNIELTTNYYDVFYYKIENTNDTLITSKLTIININLDYAGKYQCIATNEFGSINSGKSKIVVAIYPTITKLPINLTVESGQTARLNCAAIGDPLPQIAWQKDGGHDFPAARERRMHVMPKDDAFYIINAKVSDQGVYTCTAENSVGIVTANATLNITQPPTFTKPMENKEVISGKSIVLECMVAGSPTPTIHWLKDNKTINETDRHFFAAANQLLIIIDAKLSDSGIYGCLIQNALGRVTTHANLIVNPIAIAQTFNVKDLLSVIVITMVCCAVLTSVVWVIIIYQTKKQNYNNGTAIFHYECSRINETSFNDNQQQNVSTNKLFNANILNLASYQSSSDNNHLSDEGDDADNFNINIDESNPLKSINNNSSVISTTHNSSNLVATQSSSPLSSINPILTQTSNLTLPSSTTDYNIRQDSCNDNKIEDAINLNDRYSFRKLDHNLHENKLNKLENLINYSTNSNNKKSCISICSLDSIHSLKQSL